MDGLNGQNGQTVSVGIETDHEHAQNHYRKMEDLTVKIATRSTRYVNL